MTAPLTLPESERVADWPRISATLRADGTGSITVNGTERPCVADNVTALRTGMIAHVALIAARLRRPVRLVVTEDTDTWALAVRPEGIVQLVDDDGTIPPATSTMPAPAVSNITRARSTGAERSTGTYWPPAAVTA